MDFPLFIEELTVILSGAWRGILADSREVLLLFSLALT